jgi:hypothetical protein
MARTQIVTPQAFTGVDGTAISADSNWTEQNGVDGQLVINTNGYLNAYSGPSDCVWAGAGVFTDDQYFATTLLGSWSISDSDTLGGSLRNNGGSFGSRNMYRVVYQPSSSGVLVYKVVSDTATPLGTTISQVFTSGDTLEAEAVTNGANVDIIVYRNGTILATRSDTSSVLTGGKPGLTGVGSANLIRGDDWEAGNVTVSSVALLSPITHRRVFVQSRL